MEERRTRAKPIPAADRRAAIVAATEALLVEHGSATTTKLIAEAAGVAEGTIFRHFRDKREIYCAVAENVFNPSSTAHVMAEVVEGEPDIEGKLRAVIDLLAETTQRNLIIMMSVRSALAEAAGHDGLRPPGGSPNTLIEANKTLIDDLARLVFEPHAAELRLTPWKAAMVLRSLTIGAWLPGLNRTNQPLKSEDVIDVLLGGILNRETP
ncbi:TetR family transcriptional regulator [Nocardioides albertanoniae]|uniref:TetR family transcriptional regulator n=1 Tax=Nocardioides albertanoniae TaxID=1175486 RepID=A0A543AD12_9ACTN|nr:TetR/AcrR family transcriptional regulator [Nocardioides albertanoniae]TQL70469.1 TetR family transcriptional regulator [Nocardioides albertanoniae]